MSKIDIVIEHRGLTGVAITNLNDQSFLYFESQERYQLLAMDLLADGVVLNRLISARATIEHEYWAYLCGC